MNCVSRVRIKSLQMILAGAVLIVVPFHAGDSHVPDNLQTLPRTRVVSYHIAQADNVGGLLGANVLQRHLEGVNVAVYVCDYGVFHLSAGNFKITKLVKRVFPLYMFVPDKSSKT